MNTIVAILSALTFVLGIILISKNLTGKLNKLSQLNRQTESLKRNKEAATAEGNFAEAQKLGKELEKHNLDSLGEGLSGVWGGCSMIFFSLLSSAMELFVIVYSLVENVGTPLYGFIALGFYALGWVLFFIVPRLVEKEKQEVEAAGGVYIYRTNYFSKFVGIIPALYAGYIFLVLIGIINYAG